MENKVDFSKVCRTCLQEINKIGLSLTQDICKMITTCTNITINDSDGLPENICHKCTEDVKISYNFKLKSEKCDKYLRQLFDNENQKAINTVCSIIKAEHSDSDSIAGEEDTPDENSYSVNDFPLPLVDLNESLNISQNDCTDKMNFEIKKTIKRKKKLVSVKHENEKLTKNKVSKKYKCEHCWTEYFKLNSLAKHLKIEHAMTPVKCEICQKKFTLKLQLEYHMRVHGKKRFICKFCGKEVNTGTTLKSHELSHTNEDPHPCPHCRKLFKHKPSLSWHIARAHEGERKKDICTVCGVEIFHLKHHMLRKHPMNRPFKCDECHQSFGVEWAYKEHKKRHTAEYKEPKKLCTICGKKSHTATALVYHMRTHTGESPFICPICNKTTKTNSAMVAHKRTHTGERPYECPTCKRKFTTSYCAKKHQLIHTGERPYKCDLCSRPFRQKSALKTHFKTHMKVQ